MIILVPEERCEQKTKDRPLKFGRFHNHPYNIITYVVRKISTGISKTITVTPISITNHNIITYFGTYMYHSWPKLRICYIMDPKNTIEYSIIACLASVVCFLVSCVVYELIFG